MSTPQDPGNGGDTPQDPSDPQNPYGTPPTTPIPPPAPVYGTEPTQPVAPQPPPPAAPAAPSYGEQPPPPAYGSPAPPPYGDPAAPPPPNPAAPYQQPAYGVPQYPVGQQPEAAPGKGMAIAALVIAFFGCTVIGAIIAIPLAIVVLVRSRGGQNHGKGLAIAAIVVSLVSLAVTVVLGVAGVSYLNSLTAVDDLRTGDCITATGLTDEDAESVSEIKTLSCSEAHDGEVLATVDLAADQVDTYKADPTQICEPAIVAAGKDTLITGTVVYTALSVPDPEAGDQVACVAYNADGSDLTSKLGS